MDLYFTYKGDSILFYCQHLIILPYLTHQKGQLMGKVVDGSIIHHLKLHSDIIVVFSVLYWVSYEKQKIIMNQQCPSFQFTLVAGAVSGGVSRRSFVYLWVCLLSSHIYNFLPELSPRTWVQKSPESWFCFYTHCFCNFSF